MELLIKSAALAVFAAVVSLLIKKSNPEISLLLSVITAICLLSAALSITDRLAEISRIVKDMFGVSDMLIVPVMKCLALAIVSKLCADFCRDASQQSLASAVEFAGTVCALGIVSPLIISMLKMVGGLV